MSRRARKAGVLSGTRANLTGLVAWPAHATLIGKASRWTTTDARAEKEI